MGNEMKNVARGFKFLWAMFSKTMGNVFHSYGQRILVRSATNLEGLWVAMRAFTHDDANVHAG